MQQRLSNVREENQTTMVSEKTTEMQTTNANHSKCQLTPATRSLFILFPSTDLSFRVTSLQNAMLLLSR